MGMVATALPLPLLPPLLLPPLILLLLLLLLRSRLTSGFLRRTSLALCSSRRRGLRVRRDLRARHRSTERDHAAHQPADIRPLVREEPDGRTRRRVVHLDLEPGFPRGLARPRLRRRRGGRTRFGLSVALALSGGVVWPGE